MLCRLQSSTTGSSWGRDLDIRVKNEAGEKLHTKEEYEVARGGGEQYREQWTCGVHVIIPWIFTQSWSCDQVIHSEILESNNKNKQTKKILFISSCSQFML